MMSRLTLASLAVGLLCAAPKLALAEQPLSLEIASKPAYHVDQARWNKLLLRIGREGELMRMPMGVSSIFLSKVEPNDGAKPRQADYVTLFGSDDAGQFHASWGSLVSEKWEIITDEQGQRLWRIDQWLFKLDLQGAAREATHRVMVQTMERRVLEMNDEPGMSVENPKAHARWSKLMEMWLAGQK